MNDNNIIKFDPERRIKAHNRGEIRPPLGSHQAVVWCNVYEDGSVTIGGRGEIHEHEDSIINGIYRLLALLRT